MCSLLILLSLLSIVNGDISYLLESDRLLKGPGVRARLSPNGLSHVSKSISVALLHEIVTTNFPFKTPTYTMNRSNVRVSSFNIISTFIPSSSIPQITPIPSNNIHANINDVSIILLSESEGTLSDGSFITPLLLNATNASLSVTITISSDLHGNPSLKMIDCDIPNGFPMIVSYNRSLGMNSRKELVSLASHDAINIFQSVICPRLTHLIDSRINGRFGVLPPKMSLAQTANADLVKMISEGEKLRSRRISGVHHISRSLQREKRQNGSPTLSSLMKQFDFTRRENLFLDYSMTQSPIATNEGLDIYSSGEISTIDGNTPFGPHSLPQFIGNQSTMLQIVLSDFVPNSLMYHGHRSGIFNTRIDPSTPHFGSMMRSSCDLSTGSLFCIGDIFPTLRDTYPNRGIAFLFSTTAAPVLIVRPESEGGIFFQLAGMMEVRIIDNVGIEEEGGRMSLDITGTMKMRMNSKVVKGKITLNRIKMTTQTPKVLSQDELDDAAFLSHEIVQRMTNDILKDGIPIPVHPLFKLRSPKLTLMDRSIIISTNFELNSKLIHQLTSENMNRAVIRKRHL